MSSMIEDKGSEYVAAWSGRVAQQLGCPETHVAATLARCYPGLQVGDLDSARAKVIIGEAKHAWFQHRIAAGEHIQDVTHCRGCGLPLPRLYGECEECV